MIYFQHHSLDFFKGFSMYKFILFLFLSLSITYGAGVASGIDVTSGADSGVGVVTCSTVGSDTLVDVTSEVGAGVCSTVGSDVGSEVTVVSGVGVTSGADVWVVVTLLVEVFEFVKFEVEFEPEEPQAPADD